MTKTTNNHFPLLYIMLSNCILRVVALHTLFKGIPPHSSRPLRCCKSTVISQYLEWPILEADVFYYWIITDALRYHFYVTAGKAATCFNYPIHCWVTLDFAGIN